MFTLSENTTHFKVKLLQNDQLTAHLHQVTIRFGGKWNGTQHILFGGQYRRHTVVFWEDPQIIRTHGVTIGVDVELSYHLVFDF